MNSAPHASQTKRSAGPSRSPTGSPRHLHTRPAVHPAARLTVFIDEAHQGYPAGVEQTAQVDLWNIESGAICGALITYHWDGRNAYLSLEAPDRALSAYAHGRDLFDGLQQVRRQLEPLGWYPLCNGARIDCYPSGMAREMGGASAVYELTIGSPGRFPLVGPVRTCRVGQSRGSNGPGRVLPPMAGSAQGARTWLGKAPLLRGISAGWPPPASLSPLPTRQGLGACRDDEQD